MVGRARRRVQWFLGAAAIIGILYVVLFRDVPVLLYPGLPYTAFFQRCFWVLLLSAVFCFLRIVVGPTPADRAVAIDILGILVVGFCAILGIPTGRSWYIDIGIAWGLQSFIATIALAKYLEGKKLDE